MKNKHTVFTYGTLMKGYYGHDKYMGNARFISNAVMKGKMYHTSSSYPAAIHKPNSESLVYGELYHVDSDTLEDLRRYEGIGSVMTCYKEKIVKVQTEEGEIPVHAFVVTPSKKWIVKSTSRKVKHGNWRKFIDSNAHKKLSITSVLIFMAVSFILLEIIFKLSHT